MGSTHPFLSWYGRLLVITYVISFMLSFAIGWMADRFHPLRIGIVTLLLYATSMTIGGLFADRSIHTFSAAFILHGVLAGSYLTATASLGQRLFPRDQYAQFASAAGLVTALGYIVLPALLGKALDVSGHNYRITFYLSALIALLAVIAFLVVYRMHGRNLLDRVSN